MSRPESMSRQEVCRDQESMSRPGEYVVTKKYVATSVATRKLCRNQKALSRPETLRNLKNSRKLIF